MEHHATIPRSPEVDPKTTLRYLITSLLSPAVLTAGGGIILAAVFAYLLVQTIGNKFDDINLTLNNFNETQRESNLVQRQVGEALAANTKVMEQVLRSK